MFHVLEEDTIPANHLFSGYDNGEPNTVECGAKVGERRSAISHKDFKKYLNSNKLRVSNMCKACARKLGISVRRLEENE